MKQVEEVRRRALPREAEAYRPPYKAAGLAALGVWLLYAITLAPTTAFWDTSEYIATAHILGIPHPPGNPLFVVLARAWELLLAPTGLSVAVRINLFSATMSALAHGFWFLVAHRVLSFYSDSRRFRLIGAAAAVLISATAFTVWSQSNVNEKVYTVTLFTIGLLSWLAFRWRDRMGEGNDDNLLLLMVFVLALSVGNHLMAFLAAPALFVFVLLVHPSSLLNWKLYAAAIGAVVLGLSIHLYLPIRAGLNPVINEADPSCQTIGSALQSVLTMGQMGCENLSDALARRQYDKPSMFNDPTWLGQTDRPRDARLFFAQLANYFQYFDWQWARSMAGLKSWFAAARVPFTALFVALGAVGAWTHYRRDRISWAYIGALFATLSVGLVFYLNFRYGYTVPLELFSDDSLRQGVSDIDLREVRERDYFFIASFSVWGIWAGIGLAALWQDLTERLRAEDRRNPELLTAPVMLIALIPLLANWSWASRRHDWTARDWAYNLLMSVEPYGVLFTNGDNDTFPLWYLQEVEGLRQDVTVMVMSYLNTPWYVKQIRDLTTPCPEGVDPRAHPTRIICQRPYEPDEGPDFYNTPEMLRPPTRSIIQLSDEQIDEVAATRPFRLDQAQVFPAGEIESTISPGTVMLPSDVFMANIVASAIGDRPIFYAMTTTAYNSLGLRPFLIRNGVAFELNNGPVDPATLEGVRPIPESELAGYLGPYMNVPRTQTLLEDVFVHHPGFPNEWGHWVDSATEGIPQYYAFTHAGLAQVLAAAGDSTAADAHMQRFEDFFRLAILRRQ